ncbi:MAG: HAMP domain-containing histidine kinase [Acidobacteria bacterium]|jgi:two-component system OmpR family sensor kinase|nr:HAMP domain-containing histidine kinase [Acidobacteriota bacterium]
MGRLFWKFFVSYWLALVVAFAGVGISVWLYRLAEDLDPSLEMGPRARFVVASASATLRHGGLPALRALMEDWGRRGDVRLFAVDDAGRDLLDRAVPPDALTHARQVAGTGESPEVSRVSLSDGSAWLLFIPVQARPLWRRMLLPGGPPSPLLPLAAGTVASLIFGALLAWYVARPIRHLRGAFSALSQGRLETRVAPLIGRRRDEVADLGHDFDRMAQRLQTLMDAQRSLLHDVSHELRSPLARLQAVIGLARQSPQKLESSLERIESEAERLDELVGQLLTLSRLGATVGDKLLERPEQVDLVDVVGAIAADADFEARANGRRVDFPGEGELPARVRVELIHRAVENVVRNAVRHTADGTTVEVALATDPTTGGVRVSVADRGPGVAEDEIETIFEPFYRGKGGQPGRGFGLGLAIARRAVEAHGGTLHARNRQGGGLVIEMVLPTG